MTIFKEYLLDEKTGKNETKDERVFDVCVSFQLLQIKEKAKELILAAVPEYKQRNAALGLLTEQETQQIKDSIQAIRTISNQKEAEIHAIVWDGQESTRVAACDAVQNIVW
jgi:hypothetical protein